MLGLCVLVTLDVGHAVALAEAVKLGLGVRVSVWDGVRLAVKLDDIVMVGLAVMLGLGVLLADTVTVELGDALDVELGDRVALGDSVGVKDLVGLGVKVGVRVQLHTEESKRMTSSALMVAAVAFASWVPVTRTFRICGPSGIKPLSKSKTGSIQVGA